MPGTSRPRWLLPAALVGALLLAGILALTQPWLHWIDEVADEQLPTVADEPTAATSAAARPGRDDSAPDESTPDEPARDAAPTPAATGPVTLATGSFISRDHATSGEVAIVELADGNRVLTIQDLQTDNGPDLYVYLDDGPADGDEAAFDDGIDLGRLRGNVGDLVYDIPDSVDLDRVLSVGIWCDRFSSLFGAADLTPAA